jgi:excisionase family DNA binding protein
MTKHEPRIRYTLSASAAAELLDVTPRTVRRWARAGALSGYCTAGGEWRFNRAQLEAWKAARIGATA